MSILISVFVTVCYLLLRKEKKRNYYFWSILFVLYLSVALSEVIGFPNLTELARMARLGTGLFHPNVTLIPFEKGFDGSSFMNILFFIPLGVALPVMWQSFEKLKWTFLFGFSFSVLIEFSQLFTLYRMSDVNDLMMNTCGVVLGWAVWAFFLKWKAPAHRIENRDWLFYLINVVLISFVF